MKISLFTRPSIDKVFICIIILVFVISQSAIVNAGFLSGLIAKANATAPSAPTPDIIIPAPETVIHNSQNIPLLESSVNPDIKNIKDEAPVINTTDPTLLSSSGSLSVDYDVDANVSTDKISTYTVKKGDTIDSISKKLKIPMSTILASNSDLKKKSTLKIGQNLVILALKDQTTAKNSPKSDSSNDLVKLNPNTTTKDKVSAVKEDKTSDESNSFTINTNLPSPAQKVEVITPTLPSTPDVNTSPVAPTPTLSTDSSTPTGQPSGKINGGYIWPFAAGTGRVSQGQHADSAYDFSAPTGTPILAVQSGTVFIVHPTGYNGGYGKYVVINFDDGRQAIFGHMSKTNVEEGQTVKQGNVIGFVGMTGMSTGPHVHIGFHGDLGNPYLGLKVNSTDVSDE